MMHQPGRKSSGDYEDIHDPNGEKIAIQDINNRGNAVASNVEARTKST